MSRVNHRRVKELLREKRSKITDRQFFTSRILALHFEDLAMACTKRYSYNRRIGVVIYWNSKDPSVAYTNNLIIFINAGHKFVSRHKSREERYNRIMGLFAHELGHCLYTDFLAAKTYDQYMQSCRWYPSEPTLKSSLDRARMLDLVEYLSEDAEQNTAVRKVAHSIMNILEDGRIEARMLHQFPGILGADLHTIREDQWAEMPTLTELIAKEAEGHTAFESILQMILSYVKFGEIKYGDEPLSDERLETVFSLLLDLDDALVSPPGKQSLKVVNTIMVRCWDYITEFLDVCKDKRETAESSSESTDVSEEIAELLKELSGSTAEGTGNTTPVDSSEAPCPMSASEKRSETKADAASSLGTGALSESSPESEPDSSADPSAFPGFGHSESSEIESTETSSGETGKLDVSSEETGRMPLVETNALSIPEGGGLEYDTEYVREQYDKAALDIERILDTMAERAAYKELEEERTGELNEMAQGLDYGDIHDGVPITVKRISEVDEDLIEQYNHIASPLLEISRQLQRSIAQQLNDRRDGGRMNGLLVGRRLDGHAICRTDGKVFYKKSLPADSPEMAVGLLLDESGSMRSSDRITYARAAAIILYDFCRSLDIPVIVYGHSTSGDKIALYSYAEFDSIDDNDKYRMMDISAREDNRDGAALQYVAEQLSNRPEDVKLLILVSDGQPAAYGYYGTAAEEDLRAVQHDYLRRGVNLIAAAIGSDKDEIERIYGDSFLDITDLTQLPVQLTSLVKRQLQV